jgi:hypothetical protein
MKNNKWLLNFVFGIFSLVFIPFTLVQAIEKDLDSQLKLIPAVVEHKINICHKNGDSGNWNALSVDESGWGGHSGHISDYLYGGSIISGGPHNGEPDSNGDAWCKDNDPTPPTPQTATISAQKIVCNDESDLPNWGEGGLDITSTTASSYVTDHEGCEIVPWTFEWSADGVSNPGNNVGVGVSDWNTFTNTATIPADAKAWVREQMSSDYIPFTYGDTNDNSNNVSAEFYCNTDVLNYDNWDWIDPVVAGETYYCVGFNVLKEKPEPKQCDVVSDETNIIEDGLAAVETWNHPAWFDETALGGAAKWIWETFKVTKPTNGETKVFIKKFNLDSIPSSADVEIAADNGFIFEINETEVANEFAVENNYGAVKSYNVLSNLIVGENTIRMTVKNFAYPTENPEVNPAGALYKLHIVDSSCSDIPDMCKNINGYQTKKPEGYEVDDDGNCVLSCNPEINLLANGGFEEPIVTNPKKWDTFASGTVGLEWLVEWISGGIGGLELQAGVNGWLPYEANQYAELDSTKATKIRQDIPTILGKTYKLKFAYSPRPYVSDNDIEVYSDGNLLDTLSSDGTSNSNTNWISKSYEFIADDETKIEFKDVSKSDSFGGFLDNVGLYCQNESDQKPYATTNPATSITSTSTIVNGTNGDVPATNEAFWWGTTLGGPFDPAVGDASDQYPSGWVGLVATTQNLSAGGTFSLPLSSLSPNTQYYFVAWSLVDGTWYPGNVLTFTTLPLDDNDQKPIDLCPNIAGDQEVIPSGKVLRNGDCVNRQRSGSMSTLTEGRVLGASTSCGIYLNKYIKLGDKNNDKDEVTKLQQFLNEYLGLNLVVDGFYGLKTYNAVKAFQLKHQNEVLSPWVGVGKLKKENNPTGYVYKTTQRWINMIKCPELNLPMPELI